LRQSKEAFLLSGGCGGHGVVPVVHSLHDDGRFDGIFFDCVKNEVLSVVQNRHSWTSGMFQRNGEANAVRNNQMKQFQDMMDHRRARKNSKAIQGEVKNDEEGDHDGSPTSLHKESDEDASAFIYDDMNLNTKPISLWKLISLARPERCMLIISLFIMVLGEGLNLVTPLLIANAYDTLVNVSLTSSQRMSDINTTMIWVLVVHTVGTLLVFVRASINSAAGVRIVARTRSQLYDAILRQEIAFFDCTKSGELVSRLGNDAAVLEEGISSALPETAIGAITVCVSVGIMFWISPQLAGLMIGFVVITMVATVPFGISLGKLSKAYQDVLGTAQTYCTEALGAIRTVQSFAAEDKERARYKSAIGAPEDFPYWWPINHRKKPPTTYTVGFFKAVTTVGLFLTMFGLGFGALYFCLWYGLKLVNDGELTIGKLTAFQSYIFQIGSSLGLVSQFVAKLIEAQGAAARLFYLMERVPKIQTPPTGEEGAINPDDSENPRTPQQPSSIQGAVDFNDVCFAYPTRPNTDVLRNFSLSIAPNQTVALVGASGAGKSTVVGLLQRFYDVTRGSITLDGHDIRQLDMKWLRSHIAYVQQEPQLFGLSIRENILYGVSAPVSQEEIESVAREANAHDFIVKFPDGYDTLVGERGVQLSGGQKQRIAIARALLPKPQLLLLDEATSALDAESEHLVQEAIDKAVVGRTVVIVAHRLSTVQRADQIVVIDDHHIVDVGTHAELLSRCTKYQDLIKRQSFAGPVHEQ
jgi:ABC-type multidrug transport system fused ATPase/permease subunit